MMAKFGMLPSQRHRKLWIQWNFEVCCLLSSHVEHIFSFRLFSPQNPDRFPHISFLEMKEDPGNGGDGE